MRQGDCRGAAEPHRHLPPAQGIEGLGHAKLLGGPLCTGAHRRAPLLGLKHDRRVTWTRPTALGRGTPVGEGVGGPGEAQRARVHGCGAVRHHEVPQEVCKGDALLERRQGLQKLGLLGHAQQERGAGVAQEQVRPSLPHEDGGQRLEGARHREPRELADPQMRAGEGQDGVGLEAGDGARRGVVEGAGRVPVPKSRIEDEATRTVGEGAEGRPRVRLAAECSRGSAWGGASLRRIRMSHARYFVCLRPFGQKIEAP